MTLEELLRFAFTASVFFIVFKLGTAANAQSIFLLFKRPSLLLRSLLSMSIIMPACAVALAEAFELKPAVKWVLVTLAISPVPPFLPMKQIAAGGSAPYAISLLVLAILAANLPDHKSALAAILLSLVVSMIVPIPYLRWIKPRMAI
jgi:BASS family bile acid:Na+ symporter